jgi:hypothetical protein
MHLHENPKFGRKHLSPVFRSPIIRSVTIFFLCFFLFYVYRQYSDEKKARLWQVYLGLDKHLPKSPAAYDAMGIRINGQCHAMARFGPPKEDGGWNTCMHPGLSNKVCNHGDWDCPWRAVQREQWPPKNCVVYSFGSAWNFMFEVSISRLGCKVHTFDPSMPKFVSEGWASKLSTLADIEFHDIGLGGKDEEQNSLGWRMMTIESIMAKLKTERLEVLKFDIEYGEWPVLEYLFYQSKLLQTDTVRQIMLEIHLGGGEDPNKLKSLMSMFDKFGFVLWARDDNDYCSHVQVGDHVVRGCIELSYVRREVKF